MKFKLSFTLILLLIMNMKVFSQASVYEYNIDFRTTAIAELVGADGVIMRTTNAGITWNTLNSGTTNVLYANISVDDMVSAAVGENGLILVSADGGETWEVKNSGTVEHLKDIAKVDNTNWVVCGESGIILRTENSGETWQTISSSTSKNLNDINFTDGFNGVIVGNNSAYLSTTDGGLTWTSLDLGIGTVNITGAAMLNSTDGTIVGENGFLASTRDGGISWFTSPVAFNNNFNDVKFLSSTSGVAVGDDGQIAYTSDGGYTWIGSEANTDYDMMCSNFSSATDGISVGEGGVQLYSYDGGLTWSADPLMDKSIYKQSLPLKNSNNKASNDIEVKQNYPNPFNPSTTISYTLPFDSKVSVKVFDITGREVAQLVNNFENTGNHNITFNASGLSSGIYFYTIVASTGSREFRKTMKMILTK
jgi:photosystem II stability/assembly factor-like uncharacterized protein